MSIYRYGNSITGGNLLADKRVYYEELASATPDFLADHKSTQPVIIILVHIIIIFNGIYFGIITLIVGTAWWQCL